MTAPATETNPTTQALENAAVGIESEILSLIQANCPQLVNKLWAWYNTHKFSGFFGLAERQVIGYVFGRLFGPNPGVAVTGTATVSPTVS